MKKRILLPLLPLLSAGLLAMAAEPVSTPVPAPSLTIYGQSFAVVRETIPLDLKQGANDVAYSGATAHLEPDSVILRDPSDRTKIPILEQNYRNDPVTQDLLLSFYEGKQLDFLVKQADGSDRIVNGKIIRSGYALHSQSAMERYGRQYAMAQSAAYGGFWNGNSGGPVVEVDGKIRFGLPGQPLFPSLGDDSVLKPTLAWKLWAERAVKLDAELSYVTGGMSWEADYNIVAPEKGETIEVVGWVTIDNQSGKNFDNARIKLMAGDVNKLQDDDGGGAVGFARSMAVMDKATAPEVTEKAFDEYHLYTLPRPTTLLDRETKQVEFLHASEVKATRLYVYDGGHIDWNRWRGNRDYYLDQNFGSEAGSLKVGVFREFRNTEENGLGLPLPQGRVRFYRRNGDQLEFTGENRIDHTPKDETMRVYTGDAFDLVGERRRTDFHVSNADQWLEESYEVRLRNHKKEPVEIRMVEHLYRSENWTVIEKSDDCIKRNSHEIEFPVTLKPGEERIVTYKVHYSW